MRTRNVSSAAGFPLGSITLLLATPDGGEATLEVHDDGGLEPGAWIGSLAPGVDPSSELTEIPFQAAGIALDPDATYWFVLASASGTLDWGWTADSSGEGSGSSTAGASDDGSATGALAWLAPWRGRRDEAIAATQPTIVATPERTEGPYFVDEGLNRSDITIDPSDASVVAGFPMRLGITVSTLDAGLVSPLPGAQVDLWHCNAAGIYSDVAAQSTVGKKFLRGHQVANAHGNVQFRTIYPGWYPGRTVHMHFKVRLFSGNQQSYEFSSQFFFDDAATDRVYAQTPYSQRSTRDTRNGDDGIHLQGNSGSLLLLRLADDASHAVASFHVALDLAA